MIFDDEYVRSPACAYMGCREGNRLCVRGRSPWKLAPIDDAKVLRVIANYRARLAVDLGEGVVIVDGGSESHTVNLTPDAEHFCDCGDHTFNDTLCVHGLAALLLIGDERVTEAVGRVMRQAWLDQPPPLPRADLRDGVFINGIRVIA